MATTSNIQSVIHKLEEGGWARWVRMAALFSVVIYVSYVWLFNDNGFKGLSHQHSIEQAEIAREIARGHGFSTQVYRPAEMSLFEENKRAIPKPRMPDTYHAPLWSTVLAPFIWLDRGAWKMNPDKETLYQPDKVVASVALAFFVLSLLVNFLIALRLFDYRLATFAVVLMIICDRFWRFSMSGLPHMLMLFLFSLTLYALVRMVQAQEEEHATPVPEGGETPWDEKPTEVKKAEPELLEEEEEPDPSAPIPLVNTIFYLALEVLGTVLAVMAFYFVMTWFRGNAWLNWPLRLLILAIHGASTFWLIRAWRRGGKLTSVPWWALGVGLGFGLLALTHGITIWIFLGAVTFGAIYARGRRLEVVLAMLCVFFLCWLPWLHRNHKVCGSFAGVGWYSGLYQVRGTESAILRSKAPPFTDVTPMQFRNKIQSQMLWQVGSLPQQLGYSVAAPVFLLCLLHRFKRPHTGNFRWAVLSMYLWAVLGMVIFGLDDAYLKSNDLHVLFIPILSFYGLAYLLILWSRLEINVKVLRLSFLGLIFVLSGLPFLFTLVDLHSSPHIRFAWPPYCTPIIVKVGSWTRDNEMVMTDMPWAVAWYGDKRALWLPGEIEDFIELYDFKFGKDPLISGLYLTPVSRDLRLFGSIDERNAEFRPWKQFVLSNPKPAEAKDPYLRRFPFAGFSNWLPLPLSDGSVFYARDNRWRQIAD